MDEKRVVIKEQSLKNLADVLREKSGTSAQYDIDELVELARELGMPELEDLFVTKNGEYTSDKYGYGKVTVNVPDPEQEELSVTENGEYFPETYGYSKVTVDVHPEREEITITVNGEYAPETYGFSKVVVAIPEPELEEITITQAGTYTPTTYGFSKVIADIPVYKDFEEEEF